MPEKELLSPHFLTRKQLAFEHGARFSLIVDTIALANYWLSLRGITKEGPFEFHFKPSPLVTLQTWNFNLADIPIFLSLTYRDAAHNLNAVQASIFLGINGTRFLLLTQGTPNGMSGITWPTQNEPSVGERKGSCSRYEGPDPAAGAQVDQTVKSRQGWEMHGFHVQLVTDATVATRHVVLRIRMAGAYLYIPAFASQAASLTKRYMFYVGAQGLNDAENNIIVTPFPPNLFLTSANDFDTITANMQAGDDFGVPTYLFQKHLIPT